MSDSMNEETHSNPLNDKEMLRRTPPTPPSPEDFEGSDSKSSRKRERELSQEPTLPTADDSNTEQVTERKIPVTKKNRVKLDPTAEEDETPPNSPQKLSVELSTSPPHESKVRQISMKVRGLQWEDKSTPESSQQDMDAVDAVVDSTSGATDTVLESAIEMSEGAPSPSTSPERNGADTLQADAPTSMANEPSISSDTTLKRTSTMESDSSDQDNRLKRKLGDRVVSASNESTSASSAEPSKRARDDAEDDDNPREKKRPSPPPEEKTKGNNEVASMTHTKEPEVPVTQTGGFLAYASASPFASVKGPSLFGTKSSPFASASTIESSAVSSSSSVLGSKPSSQFTSAEASTNTSSTSTISPAIPVPKKPASSSTSGFAGLSSSPTGTKRSGFEAFASSSSPFASASRSKSPTGFLRGGSSSSLGLGLNRSKSPTRRGGNALNAFKAYANSGSHSFASASSTPPVKKLRAEQDSESEAGDTGSFKNILSDNGQKGSNALINGGSSEGSDEDEDKQSTSVFGEAANNEDDERGGVLADGNEKRLALPEHEVRTGEEDDETIFQVRGKLYVLSEQNVWKERGTGLLKLNVRQADGGGARIIMRKDAVYSLLLNVTLFKGMRCSIAQDPRYVRFSCFDNGKPVHYNIRVANPKVSTELLEEILAHIPIGNHEADENV